MVRIRVDTSEAVKMPHGVRKEPIYGYRAWTPVLWSYPDQLEKGPRLPHIRWGMSSAIFNGIWTRPILRNKNVPVLFDSRVRSKINRHKLGYYAFNVENAHKCIHNLTRHRRHLSIRLPWYDLPFAVYGIVSMFGTVVTHQYGYRSQHVKVEELIIAGDSPTDAPLIWGTDFRFEGIDLSNDELLYVWRFEDKYPVFGYPPGKREEKKKVLQFTLEQVRDAFMSLYQCDVIILQPQKVESYFKFRHAELT